MPKFVIVKAPPTDKIIAMYLENMKESEKQAYLIAENHLESSFDLEKSIGFIKFKTTLELQMK
jgi:hypothetical protein